jgi:hypothetical protein
MKDTKAFLVSCVLLIASSASGGDTVREDPVEDAAARAVSDVYREVDAKTLGDLPIGVFDSGTGGLTVLEAILTERY